MDIALQVRQQPARHVVADIGATVHTHTRPTQRPTPRREAAWVTGAVGARTAEA